MIWAILFVIAIVAGLAVFRPLLRANRKYGLMAMAVFAAVALGLYGLLGAPIVIDMMGVREEMMHKLAAQADMLSAKVKKDPKDLGAWAELGGTYFDAERYGDSADAFKHAVLISGGDVHWIVWYAKALVLAAGGHVTDDARSSIDMAAKLDPDNEDVKALVKMERRQGRDSR